MHKNQFKLLTTRRFFPFFIAQATQGFNDSTFRMTVLALVTFYLTTTAQDLQYWQSMTLLIFNIPFLLFSVFAGQLADKYRKDSLFKIIKFSEVLLAIFAMLVVYTASIPWMMFTIFLYGLFTAFFAPIKYATIPELARKDELLGANALVEASILLAITMGSVLGSVAHPTANMHYTVLLVVVGVATIGWIASLYIPRIEPAAPNSQLNFNLFTAIYESFHFARENKSVFVAIVGIGWFWFVGSSFITEFPLYVKFIMHGDRNVFTVFLGTFTLGVLIGTLSLNALLDGQVNAKYSTWCALVIAIICIDLSCAGYAFNPTDAMVRVPQLFSDWRNLRVVIDVFILAVSLGVYIVPLYAILQSHSERKKRARIMAVNTMMFSLFMISAAIYLYILKQLSIMVPTMFLTIGIMSVFMMVYLMQLVPKAQMKQLFRVLLRFWFRVEMKGLDNYHADKQAIIVSNHVSSLDFLLLSAFLPDELTLSLGASHAKRFSGRVLTCLANLIFVEPTSAFAAKRLIRASQSGQRVVIFPENRLTGSADELKLYEGPAFVIGKACVNMIPVRISGAQHSVFSLSKYKNLTRLRPKVILHIMPAVAVKPWDGQCKQAYRQAMAIELTNIMRNMTFENSNTHMSLFDSLLIGRRLAKRRGKIIEDMQRTPLTYVQFVARCFILGRQFKRQTRPAEYVGVLMPTSIAGLICLFALQAYRRIPAMLNFTSGFYNLNAACISAKIKTIYTSRQFVNTAKINDVVEKLAGQGLKIVYLEDFKSRIGIQHKLAGLMKGMMPQLSYRCLGEKTRFSDTSVLLFTSGSEGIPKGVALSHENLLANVYQLIAGIEFDASDRFFNSLPIFHSFGLTAASILPLITGSRAFFYPSPLHYKIIPGLVYDSSSTIMFATDTFLTGYAHYAKETDFNSIRYIFAGAEKVKIETINHWAQTYGARIFEGYGVTEASPVIAVNTPMMHRKGTVGKILPQVSYQIKPVEGIEKGGRLFVKGPNVMLGYLRADEPGVIQDRGDNWYDTGDIVDVDDNGFITILGRAKRFAKIGGEMVSLTVLESVASSVWPDSRHAAIIQADKKKGETIILITEYIKATKKELSTAIKQQGMSELLVPKKINVVDSIPVLASGKIDYVSLQNQFQD